jgi:cell division septal protein FtsQ
LALDEWVYRNPSFEIRHLVIEGGGLPPRLVQSWTGIQRGENLLRLDLDRVKRTLELVPVVASASLQRVPPHTLRVQVTPRNPVARVELPQLARDGGLVLADFYVDTEARVLQFPATWRMELERVLVPHPLPRLLGIPPGELVVGRHMDAPGLRPALRLLTSFRNSSMAQNAPLLTVDVSHPGRIGVVTDQGAFLTFGWEDLEGQLTRWQRIHEYVGERGMGIATLDLSVSNNVPVTLRKAPAQAPALAPDPTPSTQPNGHA